ncbi:MAG TPA: hypothetical protein VEK34_06045 [Methylocella sp.]|nr:hypothetical protein [Methylocella sp.]
MVGEKTRIIFMIESAMQRLGIRRFNPSLRRAAKDVEALMTPYGEPLPPNTLAEMRRYLETRPRSECLLHGPGSERIP